MNRLPDRQIDVDDAPRLGSILRAGNGHVKTVAARVGGDEAELSQEFLQVADKAWFIDDDVQAAEALRSCRNEVAFSHCAYKSSASRAEAEREHDGALQHLPGTRTLGLFRERATREPWGGSLPKARLTI